MDKYDYLIVGSGLFGSVFAYEAKQKGKKVLVIDKRPHVGGNIYTRNISGINKIFKSRFWIIWCNVRIQSQTIRKKMFGD